MTYEKQPLATEDFTVRAKSLAAGTETVQGVPLPESHARSREAMEADDRHFRAPTRADYRGWGINE